GTPLYVECDGARYGTELRAGARNVPGRPAASPLGMRRVFAPAQSPAVGQGTATPSRRLRICLVYDCLYPHTVGGAERWYRNLALRLSEEGHEVTYLTMRQWPRSAPPDLPGVRVVAVAPRMRLYVRGRRRILPPIVFGVGVLWHLGSQASRFDVVHTASFPYFPLLAAGLVRRWKRYGLFVDWHEVW